MAEYIEKGTWVEIHRIVLPGGQRAPQVPVETQQVPLEMRVKGFLAQRASLGDEVEIVTSAGRRLCGMLTDVSPAYTHSFGSPVPELLTIDREVRTILDETRDGG